MLEIFKMLLTKENEQSAKIGATYVLTKNESNPFKDTKETCKVKVKDIKEGWVLYAMYPLGGILFQNETMEEKIFMSIYKEEK